MMLGEWIAAKAGASFLAASVAQGTWYYVGLGVVIFVLAITLVVAYRTWSEIRDVEEPDTPADILASFEQAHAEGDLDDRELERVRRLLAGGKEFDDCRAADHRLSAQGRSGAVSPDTERDPQVGAPAPPGADGP